MSHKHTTSSGESMTSSSESATSSGESTTPSDIATNRPGRSHGNRGPRTRTTRVTKRNASAPSQLYVQVQVQGILLLGQTWTNTTSSTLNTVSRPSEPNETTYHSGEVSAPSISKEIIIGVSIGAVFGGILLICAGFLLIRYRRRRRIEKRATNSFVPVDFNQYGANKAELEGSLPRPTCYRKAELDANATRAELEGYVVGEMDGIGVIAELEG